MRCKIKVMLLICSALLMMGCANPAIEYFEKGNAYFDQEKWNEAIAEYDKAIADFEKCITLADNPQIIERARQLIEELSE